MSQYKRKRYSSHQQRVRFKRIRFIVIILILIAAAAAAWMLWNKSHQTPPSDAGAAPSVTASPAVETPPAASLSPSADPQQSAEPTSSSAPTPAGGDLLKAVTKNDGVKVAYLTFDDGPTNNITPKILDTLRKYNIKATFFQVGSLIKANPDMARRVYEEGHLIANHSYAHNYKELYVSEEAFMSEITKTQELITGVTGNDDFKLIRFPGGGYNAGTWGANKQKYKEVLTQNGYYYCDWNALNGDAEGGSKTAEQLLQGVKNTIGSHEDVVILMHDASAKKATAEALPSIIDYLISQGFEFRRLDDKSTI